MEALKRVHFIQKLIENFLLPSTIFTNVSQNEFTCTSSDSHHTSNNVTYDNFLKIQRETYNTTRLKVFKHIQNLPQTLLQQEPSFLLARPQSPSQ